MDFTSYEGILTWLPPAADLPSLRIKKTTVVWSMFSGYQDRHTDSLYQRICELKNRLGANGVALVNDDSTWGQGIIPEGLISKGIDHRRLDGDSRQHGRVISRKGADQQLCNWLLQRKGQLLICTDGDVAQRVSMASSRAGLSLPNDLSIISLNDDATAASNGISAFQIPFARVGYHAISSLHHRLVGQTTVPRLVFPWRLVERDSTLDATTVGPLAFRAYQLIEREAAQGLTFDQVARQLDVAHRTLSRQFTSAFGITPSRHIRNVKLSLANELLLETEERVGEIAVRCGFADASKFCVFYKRETGKTPSEFRDTEAMVENSPSV